jgi:hypothetical protein
MSVLETPRLIFRGGVTWDPITTNNYLQEYDEGDARTNFWTGDESVGTFRGKAIDGVLTDGNWNPQGTHRSTFYDTAVVGVDLGDGPSSDDPIVKCPVSFQGMLVDLEPYGGTSSQLFFDEMSFGIQGGCRVFAPRTSRLTARYINFGRNTTYNGANNPNVPAGGASVVWQTSFPKDKGLRVDPHDSPALQQFAKLLEDDDVLGLTVRWNVYCTLYFDSPDGNDIPTRAQQLHDNLAHGGFQPNPARSRVVGVLGLWRKGEPASEPGDRALLSRNPVNLPTGPAMIGSASVRLSADKLTLDLANSIPETGVNLAKPDIGDLTVVAVDGQTVIATLGSFNYADYRKEAYEASAGIITLKVDAAAAQKAKTADIQLRQQNSTVLLAETALRAIAETPNIYLDGGDTTTLAVQVLHRGRPASAGVEVSLVNPNTAADISTTSFTDGQGVATFPLAGQSGGVEQYVLLPAQGAPAPQPGLDPQQVTYVNVRTLPADASLGDPQQTPPTWANLQANVLKNWQAMAPCMDNWLDLGNPDQVKAFAPLLRKLTAKENFEAFRFMPVTRDMTAGQRALLYNFLDDKQAVAAAVKPTLRQTQGRLSRSMRRA